MITFQLRSHIANKTIVCDVLQNGRAVATLYPQADGTLDFISAHFNGVQSDDGSKSFPKIPKYKFRFTPRRYYINAAGDLVYDKATQEWTT